MDYTAWKLMHLFGVILFLGNITVTALWKMLADRQNDARVVAFGQNLVTITDFALTVPGVFMIYLSGHHMASALGGIFSQTWLTVGWSLFLASGLIWILILVPVQTKQARLAKAFAGTGIIPEEYRKLGRIWAFAGSVATVLPFLNLYFMTFKPQ